jgi:hypothetical protein
VLRWCFQKLRNGGHKRGNTTLHISCPATMKPAINNLSGKGIMSPGGGITRRHHIGMAGKGEVRPIRAPPGKQIVHAGLTLAKWQARAGTAHGCQFGLKQIKGTALSRGHRGTSNEPLCEQNSL